MKNTTKTILYTYHFKLTNYMHGMVFQQLQQFVTKTKNYATWKKILTETGLEGKLFIPTQIYPDEEMKKLITSFAAVENLTSEELLTDFGLFLSQGLLTLYTHSIQPEWKTLDLIEHTENTMHKAVRFNDKNAAPPALICQRVSTNKVVITYNSDRKMVELGIGIMKGIALHYGEKISIRVNEKEDGGKILEVLKID